MKPMNEIRAVKASEEDRLLSLPGVTAVDIGPKIVKGKKTSERAIRVYVEKKKKTVPAKELIPEEIDGVKTDVIEATFVLHPAASVAVREIELKADTGTYDPLIGGISIGPCAAVGGFVFVGTLGCLVRDNTSNELMMLSNYHVLAEKWAVGQTIAQPSRVDGGTCPAKVVGALVRSVISENVDGAVASITARTKKCSIHEIGDVRGKAVAADNMKVRKRGRTSGFTHGIVDSIDASVNVPYDDGTHTLKNQILINVDTTQSTVFGQGGDSGSVVVNAENRVVGLYFAGTPDGTLGVANPINAVLSELNVKLCTSGTIPIIEKLRRREKFYFQEKWFSREGWKDRFKEVAYEKPPGLEGWQWDWDQFVVNPEMPFGQGTTAAAGDSGCDCGSLEERVAQLEAQFAQGCGEAADYERAAIAAPLRQCADFRNAPVGPGPNPRSAAGARFHVFNYTGAPFPTTRIVNWGMRRGLDAGFRTIVTHRPCPSVSVTLVHWSRPAKIVAFNAAGAVVASRVMTAPQGVDQTLNLGGGLIVRVIIHSPQDEVVIRRYCHCGPLKPIKEKPEKFESKEFKEVENPPPGPGFLDPESGEGDSSGGSLEERLARLESALGAPHFIDESLRPELSDGGGYGDQGEGGDDDAQ